MRLLVRAETSRIGLKPQTPRESTLESSLVELVRLCRRGLEIIDLSANVFPFFGRRVDYLISASRLARWPQQRVPLLTPILRRYIVLRSLHIDGNFI